MFWGPHTKREENIKYKQILKIVKRKQKYIYFSEKRTSRSLENGQRLVVEVQKYKD
jgi:hypothetical protein